MGFLSTQSRVLICVSRITFAKEQERSFVDIEGYRRETVDLFLKFLNSKSVRVVVYLRRAVVDVRVSFTKTPTHDGDYPVSKNGRSLVPT